MTPDGNFGGLPSDGLLASHMYGAVPGMEGPSVTNISYIPGRSTLGHAGPTEHYQKAEHYQKEQESIAERQRQHAEAVAGAARVSKRQARKMMTDAIIEALKTRPRDFTVCNRLQNGDVWSVRDAKTGQLWDAVDGQMASSSLCDCHSRQVKIGFFQSFRVMLAFTRWAKANDASRPLNPVQEEALKLMYYNRNA